MLGVIHINEVHVAIDAIIFELIVVLIANSPLPRHVLHLVLYGLALIAVSRRKSALLLHSLHIEALSVLNDVLWTIFIPLQHLAHVSVASIKL